MKVTSEKEIAAKLFQASVIQQLQALGIGSHEVSFTDVETASRVLKVVAKLKSEISLRRSVYLNDTSLTTAYSQLLAEAGVEEIYLVNKTSIQTGLMKMSLENIFLNLQALLSISDNALTLVSLDETNLLSLEVFTDCDTEEKVEIMVAGGGWCEV